MKYEGKRPGRIKAYLATTLLAATSIIGGCGNTKSLSDKFDIMPTLSHTAKGIQAAGTAGGDIFKKRSRKHELQKKVDWGTNCTKQYLEVMKKFFTIYPSD
ncbi:hypothetical protein HOA55_04395 [archaeon]|nr:hypothetical protein [archaeon]MBT3577966.1 hypothetical protein [archaeon]MBT6820569.1 hypothetical protein [archaeon]MBT6955759.1 hypothetical protein [archaeon]MBT7025820.1 hypothetical protein [archaeon]